MVPATQKLTLRRVGLLPGQLPPFSRLLEGEGPSPVPSQHSECHSFVAVTHYPPGAPCSVCETLIGEFLAEPTGSFGKFPTFSADCLSKGLLESHNAQLLPCCASAHVTSVLHSRLQSGSNINAGKPLFPYRLTPSESTSTHKTLCPPLPETELLSSRSSNASPSPAISEASTPDLPPFSPVRHAPTVPESPPSR